MFSTFAKRKAIGVNPRTAGGRASSGLTRTLLAALSLLLPAPTLRAQDFTPVKILISGFQTPEGKSADVGGQAALILGLQIWRTYSSETRKRSAFDNADFVFDRDARPTTYEEVESLARRREEKANLVLWGRATRYGGGIVVEANLLVRKGAGKNKLGSGIWSVMIPTGKRPHVISVDTPDWQYEFAPIVLNPELVTAFERETRRGDEFERRDVAAASERPAEFESVLRRQDKAWDTYPDYMGIGIYESPSTVSHQIGTFSSARVMAIDHDGDWSRVQVEGTGVGWMYLPKLSQSPSEVVNFCGGIIRILRNDMKGAIGLFQEVVKNSNSPTSVKIDSYLYMAVAYDKLNDEGKSFSMIAEAYKLNPHSKATAQYLCMSYLTHLARLLARDAGGAEAKKAAQSLREVVSSNKVLFGEYDSWIREVEEVLAEL